MTRDRRMPYFRFFTTDWRGDIPLRMCSSAARGLWIDLLTLMHESDRPGLLLIAGAPPSTRRLASLLGGSEREIARLLAELERAGIFSRDGETGAIFSRRMVRDKAKEEIDRENGRGGGNPRLKRRDNPGVNPLAKAHGYATATATSREEISLSSSSVPDAASAVPAAPGDDDARAIIEAFDQSRTAAFGAEQARPWPHQTDHVTARRLIEQGATVALCRPVFDAVNAKLKAKGHGPRNQLSAMAGDVGSALAAKAGPVLIGGAGDGPKIDLGGPDLSFFNDVFKRVYARRGRAAATALMDLALSDAKAGLAEAERLHAALRDDTGRT